MKNIQRLLNLAAQLRHPETGCAWDKKQTFKSLTKYTLEEAYEVIDAIEREDMTELQSELGDLLFQVVFYAQIASEQALFDFDKVAGDVTDKLIRRHPHIFSDVVYANEQEQQQAWNEIKALERQYKSNHTDTILSGVAKNLPALVYSHKIQDRAAEHGFDWQTTEPVFDKVLEELDEVKEAWQSGDQAHIEEEIGDLLLVAVNLARHMNVDAEQALKKSTEKFTQRFEHMEQHLSRSEREVKSCSLEELESLWLNAKQHLASH